MDANELLQALEEKRRLRAPIRLVGIVKKEKKQLFFSPAETCESWIPISAKIIAKATVIGEVQCDGQEHPRIELTLVDPPAQDEVAASFAELFRAFNPPAMERRAATMDICMGGEVVRCRAREIDGRTILDRCVRTGKKCKKGQSDPTRTD